MGGKGYSACRPISISHREMPNYTLPHNERLRSLSAVRRLFADGESGFVYPFRYMLLSMPSTDKSVGVMFSVPKRMHKRAVRRNLLRRRTKEAYRLNKQLLHDAAAGHTVNLALIYSSKQVVEYNAIENAVKKILSEVVARF